MKLSEESLRRFMRLYAEFYGEELTMNEARAMASRVAFLYEHLARPLPQEADALTPRGPSNDLPSSPLGDECTEGFPESQDRLLEL